MADALPMARARPADLYAGMNGTEREYAVQLEAAKRTGGIADWRFGAVTLVLGDDCRYTPDFLVIHTDGRIEMAETKGFWRDDARVKIRTAARLFPWFHFTAHRKRPLKEGGGWVVEDFEP